MEPEGRPNNSRPSTSRGLTSSTPQRRQPPVRPRFRHDCRIFLEWRHSCGLLVLCCSRGNPNQRSAFCGAGREIRAESLKGNQSSLRPQCPGPPEKRKDESGKSSEQRVKKFAELTDNFSQPGPRRRITAGTAARRGIVPTNEKSCRILCRRRSPDFEARRSHRRRT